MKLTAKQRWTKEAGKFFRDITKIYEIDEKHFAVFYGTIENLDRFYVANAEIKRDGITFKTTTGQIRKNPATQIAKDSWGSFLMGLKALGLHEYQAKLGRPPGG